MRSRYNIFFAMPSRFQRQPQRSPVAVDPRLEDDPDLQALKSGWGDGFQFSPRRRAPNLSSSRQGSPRSPRTKDSITSGSSPGEDPRRPPAAGGSGSLGGDSSPRRNYLGSSPRGSPPGGPPGGPLTSSGRHELDRSTAGSVASSTPRGSRSSMRMGRASATRLWTVRAPARP